MGKLGYYYKQLKNEIFFLSKNIKYTFTCKKRAIYIGCTGYDNLGDEAILMAIKMMFKSHLFLYDILYTYPTAGKYYRYLFFKAPEIILLGGGTLVRKGANESYLRLLLEYKKCFPNAKIVVIGPGVVNANFSDEIGFPTDTTTWKNLLNACEFISVRGELSKSELINWGIEKKVHLFYDPTIWFARDIVKSKPKKKKIGLNFADIGNRIYGFNSDVVKKFALEFVLILKENNWKIFLYPTTKSDVFYMMEVIGLKDVFGINVYRNYKDIDSSLDFLESLDVFVGQRLHSVIFSSIVSTPFYALEYEMKTNDFLKSIDSVDYSSKVDELDTIDIYDRISQMYFNLDIEQKKLHKKVMNVKQEQIKCKELFLSKI